MKDATKARRSYLGATLGCYCPRCREGKLFEKPLSIKLSGMMKMNKTCPVCGQPTELEVGFFYGTSYVSYMLAVALSVASAIAWWLIVGFSLQDNRFIYWIIFNAVLLVVLQPWLMRLSRSLWLSWFVKYDPYWRESGPTDVSERINEEQGNNW
ncbi:DUF983 domain-containing protein [Niabella insulamsoli]|uniref:DUF983 domain-containing protein n=1 Tax=Niabella insulamsoli TaxID=3144874 RepID=UPI0031FD8842